MKPAASLSAFLTVALAVTGIAAAHTAPARRSIAVQADKDAIVVLAMWTAPSGDGAELFTLAKGAALEAQLAAKAIGPLVLTLDGKPLQPASVRTRLVENPPRSGRKAVAVLLDAPIPAGEHTVEVSLGPTGETTRMSFVDRREGAAATSGRVPEGGLVPPGTSFSIAWKDSR